MQFNSVHILLGLSTFLFAYSLNEGTGFWYAFILGIAVFAYYSLPRKSVVMFVYLLLGLLVLVLLHWTSIYLQKSLFIGAIILAVLYPWLREIPWLKTPIIACTWTLFMGCAIASPTGSIGILSGLVLLLFFSILAVVSDINDKALDSSRMHTLPQVLPWPKLRWVLVLSIGFMAGIAVLFVPTLQLGSILFGVFAMYTIVKSWHYPNKFDLDPGLLLFALGNLIYLG